MNEFERNVLNKYAKEWGFKTWKEWKGKNPEEQHGNYDIEQVVLIAEKEAKKK